MSDAEKIIGIYRQWVGEWEEVNADMRRQCLTPIGREALAMGEKMQADLTAELNSMLKIQPEDFIASVVAA